MSCFSCMSPRLKEGNARIKGLPPVSRHSLDSPTPTNFRSGKRKMSFDASERKSMLSDIDEKLDDIAGGSGNVSKTGKSFLFRELLAAVGSFKDSNTIGEGGFGKVYKGTLDGQAVAIKQLNRDGLQGNQEFIVEVLMLSLLHHPNLVNLVGYCAEGDQRLLVYEYMPMGNLGTHLFDPHPSKEPLGWNTRIKIAIGAARGLEYLHVKANPPVIYRDLKSANILLDNDFNPKLSDFGLAKLGPVGDKTHVSTRVMGTYGYCAPEYAMSGKLTVRSDVYSFGVVLLELITGRMALDSSRKAGEQNLVAWSRPYLKDRRRLPAIADPLLKGCYPVRCFYHLVAIAATCLQEQPTFRPVMREVVAALEYLQSQPCKPETGNRRQTPPQSPVKEAGLFHQEVDDRISSASL